jgi:hypothetical protein
MIKRDFILRMIEQWAGFLVRLQGLKTEQKWEEATALTNEQAEKLLGLSPETISKSSETELLAALVSQGPIHAIPEKISMLVRLFSEQGDLAREAGSEERAAALYRKGLRLLLGLLGRGEAGALPQFVPPVEVLVNALAKHELTLEDRVMLMSHYEQTGQYGRAENMLFDLIESESKNDKLRAFGIAFYRRLQTYSDEQLIQGGLPRDEVESGLKELQGR